MSILRRTAGIVVVGVILAGCSHVTIAGTAAPASETTSPTEPYRSSCVTTTPSSPGPVSTPSGKPIITVTQGSNAWIANGRTQPFAVAVYADGTAIRSEDDGTSSEAIARLTIGRIDPCRLADAGAEIVALAASDLGDSAVTDQGTTSVVMHQPAGDVTVDAYALGVADDELAAPQQVARKRLTTLIGTLRTAMTHTADWSPDRLRISTAVGPWTDGRQTLVLAFGPLVPGQQGCPG